MGDMHDWIFRTGKFDRDDFEAFMDKLKYLPSENLKAMLFSLSGFTDYVVQNSKDCVLVDLSQMYEWWASAEMYVSIDKTDTFLFSMVFWKSMHRLTQLGEGRRGSQAPNKNAKPKTVSIYKNLTFRWQLRVGIFIIAV